MAVEKDQVEHIAKLSQLKLSEAEIKKYTQQLSEIIDYNINLLNQVDTEGVAPTAQVTGLEDVAQIDEPQPSLSQEQALKNAPETENGYFRTKAILEQ